MGEAKRRGTYEERKANATGIRNKTDKPSKFNFERQTIRFAQKMKELFVRKEQENVNQRS